MSRAIEAKLVHNSRRRPLPPRTESRVFDLMAAIYMMFLASGAASLVYQVVWFKQLQFVLGSSTFAMSMTVASFFFGLSLGSLLGGKLADRVGKPLLAYSGLEFG